MKCLTRILKYDIFYIDWYSGNFRSPESFCYKVGDLMKQYKNSKELLEHIKSKGIIINNEEDALNKIRKYSYYGVINSYKDVFKDSNNEYKNNVSFDEIYALYEFDKNIRSIFLKYILEIEIVIKSLVSEVISSRYGIENYLIIDNFDDTVDGSVLQESIDKINEEINKQNGKHEALTHYISAYGFVPPFVLTENGPVRINVISEKANSELNEYLALPKGGYYTYFDFDFIPYDSLSAKKRLYKKR